MSYIGATPVIGNFQKCDAITTSATATFNLLVGGAAVSPATANNCIVSLNGVVQAPTTAFTIVGSTIVFDSALTTSDVIDFIVILGNVLDVGVPSDDTVTMAKLADGTQGDVLYYGASGAPALLGAGTSGDFLKTQGAGANPAWGSAGGGVLQVVQTIFDEQPSHNSTTYSQIDSGFAVTITPTDANSSFLLQANISTSMDGWDAVYCYNWFDSQVGTADGDELYADSDESDSREGGFQGNLMGFNSADHPGPQAYEHFQSTLINLYTPATQNVTARTFSICSKRASSDDTQNINTTAIDASNVFKYVSNIIVFELASTIVT